MRSWNGGVIAVVGALLISSAGIAGQQNPEQEVILGGITAAGWQGTVDPGARPGQPASTVDNTRFAHEGDGYRLTTGPAGMFWNPANSTAGDFTVRATFREPKQTFSHPHPFGVFIGGSNLDTDQPTVLYCVAYRDGTFLVRQLSGGTATTVVRKTPHASVATAIGPDAEITQEIGWNVQGSRAECVINGSVVWGADRAQIAGAGKLDSTDGAVGIRVSHDTDVIVTSFTVGQ